MRKAFNFFAAYYQTALELNSKDRLAFYDALIHYQLTGDKSKLQQLTGLAKFAYKSQEYSIDAQIKGYLDICKRHDTKAFSECLEPPSIPPTVGATLPPNLQVQVEEEKDIRSNKKKVGLVGEKIDTMPTTGFKINPFTIFRKRF